MRVDIFMNVMHARLYPNQDQEIVAYFALMGTPLVRPFRQTKLVVPQLAMNNKLLKTGFIGRVITAICCFTPILVWMFTALGITSFLGYLDILLLPLLGLFVAMLVFGLIKKTPTP